MRSRLYPIFSLLALFAWQNLAAQLVNDGAKISIGQDALVYVSGAIKHKSGEMLHHGMLTIGGDWVNQELNSAVFANGSSGTVTFIGSSINFSGIGNTVFPKLLLSGAGVFKMKTDIGAALSLNLGDAELEANDNKVTLFNADPSALLFNNGFISTGINGSFVRLLKENKDYIYPLGSNKLGFKRFVSVKPTQVGQQTIAATFVATDPNLGGYERSQKVNNVVAVNNEFYHMLKRINGNIENDVLFYTTATEPYQNLLNWTIKNIWDKASPTTFQENAAISGLNKSFLHQSVNLPLATTVPFAFGNVNSASPLFLYNAFSPDGDGKNDTWEVKNIDSFPDNDLKIFDRSGNLVFRAAGYNSTMFWDGKNVSSGTYIYILRVKIDGKDDYFKGAITMVKN